MDMQRKKVAIIGAGIAGMEAAGKLSAMGFDVCLLEKEQKIGGHIANWHHVFPDRKPAHEIVSQLKTAISKNISVIYGAEVNKATDVEGVFELNLTNGKQVNANAVLLTTGFDLFQAAKKEEYGYKIYSNVITSADLEAKLSSEKQLKNGKGIVPKRIAFIHCVGSRDEKTGNRYCSKVCCVTAVKQAIEVKQANPSAEVYCFYMDLRMFDRYFEDLYYEAQTKYGIRFIRGRLSEACENPDGGIILKAEDTLAGKPIKMTVDMAVLMTGMVASRGTLEASSLFEVELGDDLFIKTADNHSQLNITNRKGVFVSGACTGPKSIAETLADARSAAIMIESYLKN
jgi:heterodisulfide reductase subunit A